MKVARRQGSSFYEHENNAASSTAHGIQVDEDEEAESDSEDADLDADLEGEEAEIVLRPRYSTRNRSIVQRYSPKAGQAGDFTVGSKRRRSIAEQVQPSSLRWNWRRLWHIQGFAGAQQS